MKQAIVHKDCEKKCDELSSELQDCKAQINTMKLTDTHCSTKNDGLLFKLQHNFKNFLKFLNQQSYFVFLGLQLSICKLFSSLFQYLFSLALWCYLYIIVLLSHCIVTFLMREKMGDMKVILRLQGQILQS